ncbi:MAG: hypothetical protein J6Y44_00360 [Clostridia bacterium]|nr:hypothetical protein [Clostridia bacterium]
MKNVLLKTIPCVILSVFLFSTALFISACNPTTETAEVKEPEEIIVVEKPQVVDRSAYSSEAASEGFLNMKAYDFLASLSGEAESPFKDFMVGDILNDVMQLLIFGYDAAVFPEGVSQFLGNVDIGSLINNPDLSSYAGLLSSVFGSNPLGIGNTQTENNYSSILYSYYDDGFWRSNLTNEKVHRIMNVILCYKPFGSEPIDFTEADLTIYGETSLAEILGYKNNAIMRSVIYSNDIFGAFFDATISEINDLFSKDDERVIKAIGDIFGELSVADVAALLMPDLTEDELSAFADYTVKDLFNELNAIRNEGIDNYIANKVGTYLFDFIDKYGDVEFFNDTSINSLIEELSDLGAMRDAATEYLSEFVENSSELTLAEISSRLGVEIPEEYAELTIAEVLELAKMMGEASLDAGLSFLEPYLMQFIEEYGEELIEIADEAQVTRDAVLEALTTAYNERSEELKSAVTSAVTDYLKSKTIRELLESSKEILSLFQLPAA